MSTPTPRPRSLVPIPTSDLSPFEPGDLQYFIERTAGGAVTTLAPTLKALLGEVEVFEMGYTNLWLHVRCTLYLPGRKPSRWEPPDVAVNPFSDRIGRYFILGGDGSGVTWIPNDGSQPRERQMVLGFGSWKAAERHVEEAGRTQTPTLVTRLCDDLMWH
jgi:hypothetical protein